MRKLLEAQTMLLDELDCEAEIVMRSAHDRHPAWPVIAYKCRWLGRLTIRFDLTSRRYTVSIGDNGATSVGVGLYWVDDISQPDAVQDGSYALRAFRGHMLLRHARVFDTFNGTNTYAELQPRPAYTV